MRNTLRKLSFIEGISLLLLFFVAMPIKYGLGEPIIVTIVGSIHGALFLMLIALIIAVSRTDKWPKNLLWFALISSTVPFGMIALDKKLKARWENQ